jgi:hypothetical protein
MKRILPAAAILLLAGTPALAHRLDEYLQGTILAVEKNRMDAQITLTPGVAVFPILIAEIDTDGDGSISATEQRAYVDRVLGDLSLKIDGRRLTPRLLSMEFPAIEEMREGRGEIRIEFEASLPSGGPNRKLTLENHHQKGIAAYQVNCLVPRNRDIRILAQKRNYTQSFYELDYVQAGMRSNSLAAAWMQVIGKPQGIGKPLETIALLLFAWVALLWARRSHPSYRGARTNVSIWMRAFLSMRPFVRS